MTATLFLAAGASLILHASGPDRPTNIALGKTYRLEPAPNYRHCTDSNDRVQLTDGRKVEGYFWTQQGTVGWSGQAPIVITLDLEQTEPISGISFHTAAGVAGVEWPAAIFLLVSDDARTWHQVGDLVALSRRIGSATGGIPTTPPPSGYAEHLYQSVDLDTHGRYVTLLVAPSGSYCFVDEIEVFRGAAALLNKTRTGQPITQVREFFNQTRIATLLQRRLRQDLKAVIEAWRTRTDRVPASVEKAWETVLADIPKVTISDPAKFTTVFPINDLHTRIFALQALLWRSLGLQGIVTWRNNRWDMLPPVHVPPRSGVRIHVAMMKNEYRAAAFNLSNADSEPARITLTLTGLPGGDNPEFITVHEVPFTDTQSGVPVAAALPLAKRRAGHYVVDIPSGLTRQIWLTFHPLDVPAGGYSGHIELDGAAVDRRAIPLRVKIYPFTFPSQPTLHLGGWDYTDRERCYEVTPENRTDFIRHLRAHFVDSPWAQSSVLTRGTYDTTGRRIEPPDTGPFRTWLERWPDARNYYVFASVGEHFCGLRMGTRPFESAVSDWIRWWANQLRQWDIPPQKLGLLLVDEPHQPEQDRIIIEYAKVIRAAEPEVIIWEDPIWRNPTEATPELFELSHVLCPNLPMWIAQGKSFAQFYVQQRQAGRRLWFYSCSGPGRLLDPYSYHRMQHWFCWKYRAEGSGFWAFGDSNGASSWNEYSSRIGAYTPLFLEAASVTAGKHMEAIREGIEDYEYLRMLRDRVAELEKQGVTTRALARARQLLEEAPNRVTDGMTSASLIHWKEEKDRTVADRVRIEVLEVLEALK